MLLPNSSARRTSVARASAAGHFSLAVIVALLALSGARTAHAQSLPQGWADQDIGVVGLAGSATYSGGTFTVRGAGADIWGTADSFHFANLLLSGDGEIVARVASMGNTNTYAKAGVMIRETLTADSRHVVLDLKPGGGVEFMARTATGGTTSFIAGGTGTWLKLVRSNGVFTASLSTNGLAWTVVGSRAVTMGPNVFVGLAVCSHNTSALNTSLFDNVTVTPASGADQPPTVSITSPAAGAKFTAGASVTIAATASDTDATPIATVSFYANNGTTNTLLGTDTTSPYSFTWTTLQAGSYSLTAVATDTASHATTSSAVAIGVGTAGGGLPAGWADQDIGSVGLAGSAAYNGTFTVQGAGADVWGTADSFHFANQLLSGDGQIVARVASMDNTNTYAKAGVMIRETLTPGSPHVLLDMKPNGGVEFLARTATSGTTSFVAGGTGRWLKLVRSNGVFTASVSADGGAWSVIGSRAVTMAGNVWVGLAVCSHNAGVLNTSLFDSVAVTAGGGTDAPPTVSITSPTSGATFAAGTSISISASAIDGDATPVAKVEFYANGQLLGTDTTSPYSISWSNVAAGSYSLTAVATDSASHATTSGAVSITVSSGGAGGPLPSGWSNQDVGAVGIAGSASFSNGIFTVKGAGADIWGTADSFQFASRSLGGVGEIVAHVASMTNTHTYAKAGVMIRDSMSASSPHVTVDVKPNGTVEFLARTAQGGPTTYLGGGTGNWVKLVRNGGFTAYVSKDGSTWQLVGSTQVAMLSATVRMGLAVCSVNVGALNTAVFDNVAVTGSTTGPTPPVITSPPTGSTFPFGSSPVLTATASEDVIIDLYADDGSTNRLVGSFRNRIGNRSPTSIWYHPQPGSYKMSAVAHYPSGWATSSPVTIHISDTLGTDVPPTVTIASPTDGSTLPLGPVTITATGTDPDSTPVASVDYWLEEPGYYYYYFSSYLGRATASPYAVTWTPTRVGDYSIIAVVTDTAGLSTASWIYVSIR